MNLKKRISNIRWEKKRRGVSPVIAEIMLLGLVLLAASIAVTITFITINTKDPIDLRIVTAGNWRLDSSDISTTYNTVDLILSNPGTRHLGIEPSGIVFTNVSSGTVLTSWSIQSEIKVFAQQRIIVEISTSLSNEFLTRNSTVEFQITAFALDEARNTASTNTQTLQTVVIAEESIIGPLILNLNTTQMDGLSLSASNNSLAIDVLNYGGTAVNYTLDIFTSNKTLDLTLQTLGGINASSLSDVNGNITAASILIPSNTATTSQTMILTVNNLSISEVHFIYIWLKVGSQIYDTKIIPINP